jgi:phosphatidylglycerophosphatase A
MTFSSLARWVATFFRVGDLPLAPGTAASACGLLLAYLLRYEADLFIVMTALVTAAGFLTAGVAEKAEGRKDPGCIVIDEVSGIMIAFFMLPSYSWPVLVTGFFLFRAFDMFKVYPASKFESWGGARGIMLDDIMAGVYTNLILQAAVRLSGSGALPRFF